MNNYYQYFLNSMSDGQPPEEPAPPPKRGGTVIKIPVPPSSITLPYSPAPYFQQPSTDVFPVDGNATRWKRNMEVMVNVKHKRTRSGCYMCRSRRIKCDETRPVCERCQKGNRECIYPEPKAPDAKGKKKSRGAARNTTGKSEQTNRKKAGTKAPSPGAVSNPTATTPEPSVVKNEQVDLPIADISDGGDDDQESDTEETTPNYQRPLETIPDEDESSPVVNTPGSRNSIAPVKLHGVIPPPYAGASPGSSMSNKETPSPAPSNATSSSSGIELHPDSQSSLLSYAHLDPPFVHSMNYFHANINHYHYGVIADPDKFFSVTLPNLALYDDALCFGLIAFSKYMETLENPDGDIDDFITPFNNSVTILLKQLRDSPSPTIVMLAVVLQLATIEEYLGDWVSVSGHQTAAKYLIEQLYTVDNIMETPIGRQLLAWYSRFDCYVAILGRLPCALSHKWYAHYVEDMANRAAVDPDNVLLLQEQGASQLRYCSEQIASLNHMGIQGKLSPQEYISQHGRISSMMSNYLFNMNAKILDPAYVVDLAAHGVKPDPYGVVDLFNPEFHLYAPPLFGVNVLRAEFHSIMIMHNFSQAMADRTGPLFLDCQKHAYAICTIFEAIEKYPHSPKGGLILVQSCLSLAVLFFPPDSNHRNWLREKFAKVEQLGYIQATTSRNAMTLFFDDPTISHWWLPNDQGFHPVLRSLRKYKEERTIRAKAWQEEIEDPSHILSSLQISN